jgi:transposase
MFVDLHFQAFPATGERVRDLEQNLEAQVAGLEPAYSRLRSVPDVGAIVAATALASLSEPERFGDAKHAASYAGLVPQMDQSGDVHRGGHITKGGPAELRAMLCEAAHQAARRSNPLNPLFLKLSARLGY